MWRRPSSPSPQTSKTASSRTGAPEETLADTSWLLEETLLLPRKVVAKRIPWTIVWMDEMGSLHGGGLVPAIQTNNLFCEQKRNE